MSPDKQILNDHLHGFAETQPVSATFLGLHEHDHRLPLGIAGVAERLGQLSSLERRLGTLTDHSLSLPLVCDHRVVAGAIRIEQWELDSGFMLGNPSYAVGEAVFGLISLVLREFDAWETRSESLLARLASFGTFFDALPREGSIPSAWVTRALREVEGARLLIREGLPTLFERGSASAFGEKSTEALASLERFAARLEHAPRSDDYAAGEAALCRIISDGHFLEGTPQALLVEAERVLAESERRLVDGASAFGVKTWRQALQGLEPFHPQMDSYYESYDRVWADAKAASDREALVSWPEFPIRYLPVPDWAKAAAPFLYFLPYRSPAPFDEQDGVDTLVPTPDPAWDSAKTESFLARVNDSVIKLNHVVHHGGLGHHVQNTYAARAGSRMGRIAATDTASRIAFISGGTMAEGWACYATELMDEVGFLTSLESFSQHHARARMAARAIVDIRLHCRDMSFEEAVRFYVERTAMSEAAARGEVTKNSMFPGAALMYLFGVRGIRALRDQAKEQWADAFSLKRFHERLLSFGSLPVAMIAEIFFQEQ